MCFNVWAGLSIVFMFGYQLGYTVPVLAKLAYICNFRHDNTVGLVYSNFRHYVNLPN